MDGQPKHSVLKTILVVLVTAVVAGGAGYFASEYKIFAPKPVVAKKAVVVVPVAPPVAAAAPKTKNGTLRLTVLGVDQNGHLSLDSTCFRQNASPGLRWSGVPVGTKSFAAVLARQDKPRDAVYWAVFNIPGSASGMGTGLPRVPQFPDGTMQATNDHGDAAYIGPCEPRGVFHFVFRLYALDSDLNLKPSSPVGQMFAAMKGHVLDEADVPVVHYLKFGGPQAAIAPPSAPAKAGTNRPPAHNPPAQK